MSPPAKFHARKVLDWMWLPLLAVVLCLWFQLHRLQAENESPPRPAGPLTAGQTVEAVEKALPANPSSSPSAVPETKRPGAPRILASFSDRNAVNDPEFAGPILRRQRRYAMANYRRAIDALELSTGAREHLKELIVAQWNAREDAGDILDQSAGDNSTLRTKAALEMSAQAERENREFLGDEAYTKFQAGYEERVFRTTNWQLFTGLWDVGLPMTDEQKDQLAQVHVQVKNSDANQMADLVSGLSPADEKFLQASSRFLSPAQVSFIREEKVADYRARHPSAFPATPATSNPGGKD